MKTALIHESVRAGRAWWSMELGCCDAVACGLKSRNEALASLKRTMEHRGMKVVVVHTVLATGEASTQKWHVSALPSSWD